MSAVYLESSALLAWLLGPHRHIVVDEFHHGIARETNFATLARR